MRCFTVGSRKSYDRSLASAKADSPVKKIGRRAATDTEAAYSGGGVWRTLTEAQAWLVANGHAEDWAVYVLDVPDWDSGVWFDPTDKLDHLVDDVPIVGRAATLVQNAIASRNPVTIGCDARCNKAWGHNGRPRNQLSEDPDDYEWLGDDELGTAPPDTGIWDGGHTKPQVEAERLNKWCYRECERCSCESGHDAAVTVLDFSRRIANKVTR